MSANYKEQQVEGTSWTRSHHVIISNPLDGAAFIEFHEQTAIVTNGQELTIPAPSVIRAQFKPGEVFPLINPQTGDQIGANGSHIDLYVLLHSLYRQLAQLRDEEEEARLNPPHEDPPADPPPEDPPADPPPEDPPEEP